MGSSPRQQGEAPEWADANCRAVLEAAPDALLVVNEAGKIVAANLQTQKLYGYSREYLIGRVVESLIPARLRDRHRQHRENFFANPETQFMQVLEIFAERGDASEFPVDVSLSRLTIGSETFVVSAIRDATERRRIEELKRSEAVLRETRESEKRYRRIVETTNEGVWLLDSKLHTCYANRQMEEMLGYEPGEMAGRSVFDFYFPEDLEHKQQLLRRRQQGVREQIEERLRRRDGSELWLRMAVCPLMKDSGEFDGALAMVSDITERRRVEEKLRESEARERAKANELEAILEAVPVPVLIAYDKDCQQMKGNRAAYEQLHVAANQNFSQSAPADKRPAFRQMQDGVEIPAHLLPMQQAAATGKPMYGRLMTAVFPDGTKREELANAVPLLDEEGRPRGAVGTSIDLTELRQMEQARSESEDKLRLLLDSTAEAIYGIDLEHRCTFCNRACLHTLGYECVDEVLGKNMHNLIHHNRADGALFPVEECRVHRVTQTGEGVHAEDEVMWRANGTSFPVEYWSYPQQRGNEIIGAVVAFIDITERKLSEAALANVSRKLIEAQEQERTRIGRELHDDIGQRLSLLAVQLQGLNENAVILPEVRSSIAELQKEASEIAADIQSLSHELHSAKLQYLGITGAMRGFCQEFGNQQKMEVDFTCIDMPGDLSPDISLCLFRVLQEALHNSAKHSGVRHFEVRLWGTSGEIHLTVKDSGAGFDREAARTSRGLGLVSMEERLKLVNGTLSIDSQPKRGTTIHARVPRGSGNDSMRATG
jgi:PAS domain S-box-containing protein